ncbi:MAG: DUF2851 family protein [Bacteroidales bacterium]|nr:DUF2851 family protein [Bacteroidales bacterium]
MGINSTRVMMMSEDFLHYVWRFRLLREPLFCVTGEPVAIVQTGEYNRDGGPDFLNARIRIAGTLWAGNVEIHLNASDWFRHGHETDPAYNNVILHVVDRYDKEVIGSENQPIPCLEVGNSFPERLTATYKALLSEKRWIPCQNMLKEADPAVFKLWTPALAYERLRSKVETFRKWKNHSDQRWDELTYQVIAGAMGNKINAHPFELLARSAPLRILQRHRDQVQVLEALLFGQSGLLNSGYSDAYPKELLRTYLFYKDKYSLMPLEQGVWKFLRLRPGNFPTIRISQLADIIHRTDSFQSLLHEKLQVSDWIRILPAQASRYWDSHYTFDRESGYRIKRLGESAIFLLLINGVAPLLFMYGTEKGNPHYMERSLSLLEEIPGEKNAITSAWSPLGMPVDNALSTQALKHLKDSYCDKKRCLDCRIGARILR